jgi:hypothetical protein
MSRAFGREAGPYLMLVSKYHGQHPLLPFLIKAYHCELDRGSVHRRLKQEGSDHPANTFGVYAQVAKKTSVADRSMRDALRS